MRKLVYAVLGLALITLCQLFAFAADGDVDTTFNPNANGVVYSIAVQADSLLLVGGDFTNIGGQPRNHLARLDPATGLADSFDPNVDGVVRVVVVQPDGKILIGGSFANVSGMPRNCIARLNANGTLDTAFDPNSTFSGFPGFVNSISVLAGGSVLVGGDFNSIGGQTRERIARLDAITGAADGFNAGSVNGGVLSIAVQADGNFVVVGNFTTIGGQNRSKIARLDAATGAADTFDPNPTGQPYRVALQPDGKVLVGGQFSAIGGQTRRGIARLDPVTGLADSWDPNSNGVVWSIAMQADGKIFVGGTFSMIGGQSRKFIARLDAVTGLPDAFNAGTVSGFENGIQAIIPQTGGKVLIGGDFASIAGQPRNNIARLFASSGPTAADVSISGRVTTAEGRGIRNAVMTLTDLNGNPRNVIAGVNGYYRFDAVETGQTYVLSIRSRRFQFDNPTRVISVVDNIYGEDFSAVPFVNKGFPQPVRAR
ncbi:MAG: hypothetical protein IPI64_01915 [Chloracidobacterium sp.]|nr:hypothetical protein [Chloracidobacterium sp.]